MTRDAVRLAASRLWEAATTRVPCAPIRDLVTPGDATSAYAVATSNHERVLAERGWRLCGRKIGLTSPAVQRQLGVDQPDYGALYAELAHGSGEVVPTDDLLQPKVEAEVALIMASDLDHGRHTLADVITAVDYVVPALEIVDSRIAGWDITFVDTVADNASAGRFVLGTRPVLLNDVDLADVQMEMSVNGEVRSTGHGRDCLGHPLLAARWLADIMSQSGTPIRAGDIVLTGALGPMSAVGPASMVRAELHGLGNVEVEFAP